MAKKGYIPIILGAENATQRAGQILTASRSAVLPKAKTKTLADGRTVTIDTREDIAQKTKAAIAARRPTKSVAAIITSVDPNAPSMVETRPGVFEPSTRTGNAPQSQLTLEETEKRILAERVMHHIADETQEDAVALCHNMKPKDRFIDPRRIEAVKYPCPKCIEIYNGTPANLITPTIKKYLAAATEVETQNGHDDLESIFADEAPKTPRKGRTKNERAQGALASLIKGGEELAVAVGAGRSKIQPETPEDVALMATPIEERPPFIRTKHEVSRAEILHAIETHGIIWVLETVLEAENLNPATYIMYAILSVTADDGSLDESGYAFILETLAKNLKHEGADNLKSLAFYLGEAYFNTFGKRITGF